MNELARVADGGISPANPALLDRVNAAIPRLMDMGMWKGTVATIGLCSQDHCISLPRELDTVLGLNVNGSPWRIQNEWYEYITSGYGKVPPNNANTSAGYGNNQSLLYNGELFIDKGITPTIYDVCGNCPIRVYNDVAETAGTQVLIQGIDQYGNEVRSLVNGTWISGEYVTLASPYATTVNVFQTVNAIIKPTTNGYIRVYAYNTTGLYQIILAVLHPDETSSQYRRYYIPTLPINTQTGYADISMICKKRFFPITDYNQDLIVQSVGAIKCMLQTINYEERNDWDSAAKSRAYAQTLLDNELQEYKGPGQKYNINLDIWGSGANVQTIL
jgi:ribulose bisphosphate carboxylase small subunit